MAALWKSVSHYYRTPYIHTITLSYRNKFIYQCLHVQMPRTSVCTEHTGAIKYVQIEQCILVARASHSLRDKHYANILNTRAFCLFIMFLLAPRYLYFQINFINFQRGLICDMWTQCMYNTSYRNVLFISIHATHLMWNSKR